jgi:hypothetical protein
MIAFTTYDSGKITQGGAASRVRDDVGLFKSQCQLHRLMEIKCNLLTP